MFVKEINTKEWRHWLSECFKQVYLPRSLVKTRVFPSLCLRVVASVSASWNLLVAPTCYVAVSCRLQERCACHPVVFVVYFLFFVAFFKSAYLRASSTVSNRDMLRQYHCFPSCLSFPPSSSFCFSSLLEAAASELTLIAYLPCAGHCAMCWNASSYLIFTVTLEGEHSFDPHFADEETETQRGEVICPRTLSCLELGRGGIPTQAVCHQSPPLTTKFHTSNNCLSLAIPQREQ